MIKFIYQNGLSNWNEYLFVSLKVETCDNVTFFYLDIQTDRQTRLLL